MLLIILMQPHTAVLTIKVMNTLKLQSQSPNYFFLSSTDNISRRASLASILACTGAGLPAPKAFTHLSTQLEVKTEN